MLIQYLKELSLDDLMKLLANKQIHLDLSKTNNAGHELIEFNKKKLEQVQQAIANKKAETLPRQ